MTTKALAARSCLLSQNLFFAPFSSMGLGFANALAPTLTSGNMNILEFSCSWRSITKVPSSRNAPKLRNRRSQSSELNEIISIQKSHRVESKDK